MDDSQEKGKREDDIKIGWGPLSLEATGKQVVNVVLVCALAALVIYHDASTKQFESQMLSTFEEIKFLLSLPEDQRRALNLQMPDTMRAKLLEQERIKRNTP